MKNQEKKNILVVDDESGIRETLKDILQDEGYNVVIAADGSEAVEIARNERFDVALIDFIMPGINGVDTLRELKVIQPGLKVMMMTAFAEKEKLNRAMESGASCIFEKPLDIKRLLSYIGEISRRIVLIGSPGVGKTTLLKMFFEGLSPAELLGMSLEPTRGLEFHTYSAYYHFSATNDLERKELGSDEFPFTITVIDASGQELEKWLGIESGVVFSKTDIVYHVFDVSCWLDDVHRVQLKKEILNIMKRIASNEPVAFFCAVGNKFDKIPGQFLTVPILERLIEDELGSMFKKKMNMSIKFKVFVTSLSKVTVNTLNSMIHVIGATGCSID
ncbi:MAG: response regulator [Candidatus Hodarchaeota archaeon]